MKQRLMIAASVVVVLGALGVYSFRSSGQQQAQQVQRLQINIVDVKPDMIDAWIDMQTKQTVPALVKAGVVRRDVYQTAIGRTGRFITARPVGAFAERDSPNPIEKALGAAGAKEYFQKIRAMVAQETTSVIERVPEATYDPNPEAIYKVLLVSFNHITPGHTADYINFLKTDILPVQQKAQTKRYAVSRVVFGGDPNQIGVATWFDKFADLDMGPAINRVLGPDAAAKLGQKTAGIVQNVEREVYIRNIAMSIRSRPTS